MGVTSTVKAGMDKAVGEFQAGADQMAGEAQRAQAAIHAAFAAIPPALPKLPDEDKKDPGRIALFTNNVKKAIAPVKALSGALSAVFKAAGIVALIGLMYQLIESIVKAINKHKELRKRFEETSESAEDAIKSIMRDAQDDLPFNRLKKTLRDIEEEKKRLQQELNKVGEAVSDEEYKRHQAKIDDLAEQAKRRAERDYSLDLDKRRAKMVKDAEDDAYKQSMADAERASNLATKEKQYRQELIDMFEEEDRRRLQAIEDRAEAERSAAQERARSLEDAAERIERLFDEKISVSINALGSQLDTIIARIGRRNP